MEDVTVLIGKRGSSSEVSGRVGAFGLEGDRVWLVHAHLNLAVEQGRVGLFRETNVGVTHGCETSEAVVGILQICGAVGFSLTQRCVVV